MIDIYDILKMSWTKDTCVLGCKDDWNLDNPSLGQCAITALVVNDFMGGNKRLKIYG